VTDSCTVTIAYIIILIISTTITITTTITTTTITTTTTTTTATTTTTTITIIGPPLRLYTKSPLYICIASVSIDMFPLLTWSGLGECSIGVVLV